MSTPRRSAPKSIGTPMTSTRCGISRSLSRRWNSFLVIRLGVQDQNAENRRNRNGDKHSADAAEFGTDEHCDDHNERREADALTDDPRRDEVALGLEDRDEQDCDPKRMHPAIGKIRDRRRGNE